MIGYGELIVILCIILILFGGKKLPEFAKSLGKAYVNSKKPSMVSLTRMRKKPLLLRKKKLKKKSNERRAI